MIQQGHIGSRPHRLASLLWWAGVLALLVFAGCGGNAGHAIKTDSEALVRVTPLKPVKKTLIRRTEQPGQIVAIEQTPIFAKVNGYVGKVHVDIGDKVNGPQYDGDGKLNSAGQILLEIFSPELEKEWSQKQAGVEQAKAEVKQAQAQVRVAEAMRDSADALVLEAQASTARAEAEYVRWQSELDRYKALAAQKAVTEKLVDETQSKFRAAESARKETAAKIDSAKAQRNESDALVGKAEADLEASRAKQGVAEADAQRLSALNDYRMIRAPFSGIITARNVDAGHLIPAGGSKEPLLVLVRADTVRIFVDVPEVDATLVENDAEVTIRVPAQRGEPIKGRVTRTAWTLNVSTRTLRTEIDVPNADSRLRPGMYVMADLKVAERPDALVLPKSAIIGGSAPACWRIQPSGELVKQSVQLGLESGNEVEIVSGLTDDEQLIGVNVSAFREGQYVEIVPAK